MKKLLILLPLLVVLSGCATLFPEPKVRAAKDLVAFEQAFSQFETKHSSAELESFVATYPNSPWAARANSVLNCVNDIEQRNARLQKMQAANQELENKISQLKKQHKEQLNELKNENGQLTETIEQLKGSLIELEQRPQ